MTNTDMTGGEALQLVKGMQEKVSDLEGLVFAETNAKQSALDRVAALEAEKVGGFVSDALRKRFDEIEREICEGKHTAASAFTQMRTAAYYTAPAPAERVEQEPFGWFTEDYDSDKSATTYSREVADRWIAKGWPVHNLYDTPQPSPAPAAPDVAGLVDSLKLALEYWQHRQQRYKNRRPAWVERAEAALATFHREG